MASFLYHVYLCKRGFSNSPSSSHPSSVISLDTATVRYSIMVIVALDDLDISIFAFLQNQGNIYSTLAATNLAAKSTFSSFISRGFHHLHEMAFLTIYLYIFYQTPPYFSEDEWLVEAKYVGKLWHPNLAKLVGYCLDDHHRHLVYEFIPNGNLQNHSWNYRFVYFTYASRKNNSIHFKKASYFSRSLSWNLYVKIVLGAAKGLKFLHDANVIYRDFKASKILLDSNCNAKLYDYGFANDSPTRHKCIAFARYWGTAGYAAPEFTISGLVTTRSNVYAFGVVLLKILTGKPAIWTNKPSHQDQDLVERAEILASECIFFRDANPTVSTKNVVKFAQLALECVSTNPKLRPNMKEVVEVLEELQDYRIVKVT
ncbi:probable serine/threonine-protein kinase PBL10 [Mercurialis annua]|uniref:probable serine/threonine-protein kinase PBL10 n=1 Tax=Mercurialis annua TaxID=3986 RepID=UPI0024AFDEE9|nr:probable serine/threonine-protein kinase PBL10 [Mercurialis annua]